MNPYENRIREVLYHHRTQGKAVEGIHIRGVVDALRALGIHVEVLSLPGADPYTSPKTMSPTRQATPLMRMVSSLPEPFFELAEFGYNIVALVRILNHLRKRPAQLIYERYSLYMFVTVLAARWKGIPLILEVNDAAFVHRVRPLFFARFARGIERWVFRHCSGLVFVSGVFRDRATAVYDRIAPSIVSPNAANLDQFTMDPGTRESTRIQWNLQGSVVCGYLGAFLPWHGIDHFVYRIADRLAERPALKLLLVGDGPIFQKIQCFIEERGLSHQIVMTGRVSHDQVPGLLASMDLAVLPSAGDYTSPVKLFEFMACGIPPIAPDFDPIREVIIDGTNGWIFPAGNVDAAIDAVLQRSADDAALRRVGAAARAYIGKERQWRNNAQQLLDFCHSLQGSSLAT